VTDDVADFVLLTTLDDGALARHLEHPRMQAFATIQHIQSRHIESHPTLLDVLQQMLDDHAVLSGVLV
jgi:hypothetical protein